MAQVEEDPAELLDPLVISEVDFPTALSVAFFECRLFLRGTFEAPLDLLGRVAQLKDVRTWVVQGTGDEVRYHPLLISGARAMCACVLMWLWIEMEVHVRVDAYRSLHCATDFWVHFDSLSGNLQVCPEKFAQELVARLKIEGVVHTAHFVDAGHRASSDGITVALKACVNDFLSGILTGHSG
jgi:hypothetical protein